MSGYKYFAAIFLTSSFVNAQMRPMALQVARLSPDVSSRQMQLKSKLQPSARQWIEQQGQAEAKKQTFDVNSVKTAVIARFGCKPGGKPGIDCPGGEADVETLVALVMAEIANSSEADLRSQMDEMKKQNESKKTLRDSGNETRQMKLQMATERRSKAIETLSNLMKKSSETSESLIKNLK